MYRVGITLKNGTPIAENFPTKDDCYTWILEQSEKQEIKKAVIVNRKNLKERYIEKF